jgi:transcriptional regulator with XRE-family HTH domain
LAVTREARRVLVWKILRDSALKSADLARDAGVSDNALRSWLTGRRVPEPESLIRLAEGLERRAARLTNLAEALREAAK